MPFSRLVASVLLASAVIRLSGGLHAQSPAPEVVAALKGHADTVEAVAISPDGTLVATASFDRTIKLFDLASAKEIRTYGGDQGHKGQVLAVAFNAKGDQIATGGADNFARVWDVPVSFPSKTFALAAAATRVVIAADGKTVGVASADGTVKVFPQGEEKGAIELKGHSGAVQFLALAGASWVTAGADHTFRLWSADGKPAGSYTLGGTDFSGLVAAGQSVFTATSDGVVRQWPLTSPPSRTFPVLKDAVTAFAASADGNTILTATADKIVTVGTVSNNQAVATLTGAKTAIQAVALSPDNAVSAAGCADGSVTMWGRQGKVRIEFEAHTGGVAALEYHPSQPILYTAGADGSVKGWALPINPNLPADKAASQTFKAHTGAVTALKIHPGTGQVITAGADKLVRVWNPASPSKAIKEIGPLPAPTTALALSRDGQLLAAAAGKDVRLWNAADGKELARFTQPADVTGLSFNGDKSRVLVGRADNLAALLDAKDGTVVQTFAHAGAVRGVLAHPTTPTVITASADKSVTIAPIAVQRAIALGGKPKGIIVSPDGQRIVIIGPGKACTSFLTGNGQKERDFATGGDASAAAISKDGQRLAAAGADGSVNLYTVGDGKLVGTFAAGGPVSDLAFHPTAPLVVGIRKNDAVAWSVAYQSGQPLPKEFGHAIQTFPHPKGVASPSFSADGQLYTAGEDKLLRRFRIASDQPAKNLQHPNLVDCVAFDDTGTRLATGCHDGVLRIWDLVKNTPLKTISAHVKTMPRNEQDPIYAVLWTLDHKQVFTASYDKTIKLWDAASGNLVREFKAAPDPKPIEPKKEEKKGIPKVDPKLAVQFLGGLAKSNPPEPPGPPGHRDQVFSLALTKDGKFLATGSSDKTLKLWDVSTGRVVRDFPNPDLKPVLPGELAPSHPGWVQCVRLTPDNQFLVSAGPAPRGKSYIAVWRMSDGQRVYGVERDAGPIHSIAITADGKKLVIGAAPPRGKQDGEAVILKLPR